MPSCRCVPFKDHSHCPKSNPAVHAEGGSPKWPRQSHPQALTPAGQKRTPWLTSWARATFEQGVLSVLPMLEGPCTAASLPGEHLFQASALPRDRMRPAIFHAFGKAKIGAQAALRDLEKQGWETLPMAMPNLPPAWMAFFFTRARTPCGRCAQVIVEGKETQHIDGEK